MTKNPRSRMCGSRITSAGVFSADSGQPCAWACSMACCLVSGRSHARNAASTSAPITSGSFRLLVIRSSVIHSGLPMTRNTRLNQVTCVETWM